MPVSDSQAVLPLAVTGICCGLIFLWLRSPTGREVVLRLPGEDSVPVLATDSNSGSEVVSQGSP